MSIFLLLALYILNFSFSFSSLFFGCKDSLNFKYGNRDQEFKLPVTSCANIMFSITIFHFFLQLVVWWSHWPRSYLVKYSWS